MMPKPPVETTLPWLSRLFAAIIAVLSGAESTARATAPWTLEEAIDAAVENSPDANIAAQRMDAAEATIQQAHASKLPQVFLQGRYTWTNNPMMAFGSILNQRAFDPSLDFNNPGNIDNLNATGTIVYNLYNGGRASAAVEAAESGALAANQDAESTRLQLASAVVRAYFDIWKTDEAATAIEAGMRSYEAALEVARARFEAGQIPKADLLSLEVQLAQAREDLLNARHGRALAGQAFHYVLGREPDGTPVELLEEDPSIARLRAPPESELTRRPELLSLEERVRAAEAMIRAARGARQPTVNAFASYQYDHGWQTDQGDDAWAAGISVDLNIFDGGAVAAKIRKAEAEHAAAREMLRRTSLAIALEVQQARLAHESALERISVATRSLEQADESASLSRARFAEGALLSADLIAIEARLIEARMRRVLAEADERIAVAELRRALGLSPLETL